MKIKVSTIVAALAIIAAVLSIGIYVYNQGTRSLKAAAQEPVPSIDEVEFVVEETKVTSETVEQALEPAGDLVSLAYHYTNASTVSDVKKFFDFEIPLTESKAVFTYSGVVKVGYDLSEVGIEVDDAAKTITLTLPAQKIVSNEIDFDSFEYVVEESSVFNPQKMSESTAAIDDLKKDAEKLVKGDAEFADEARANAEVVLTSFLRAAGIAEDYSIEFA